MPDEHPDAHAETPSITRLEGSRWRGGRLWSWNRDLRAPTGGERAGGGARATLAAARSAARVPANAGAPCWITRSAHTALATWASTLSWLTTLMRWHGHEVSKFQVRVATWTADRIGPTIIA